MAYNQKPDNHSPSSGTYTIHPARTPADIAATADLFIQYTTWLNIDLTFQDYATELASLPGKYDPSQGGEILLAREASTGQAVGCIALRSLHAPKTTGSETHKVAELKRLYIDPSTRGSGLGTSLTQQMLDIARGLGYHEIKLDTLTSMQAAIKMYERLGFKDIEPYYDNPVDGVRYLGLRLT